MTSLFDQLMTPESAALLALFAEIDKADVNEPVRKTTVVFRVVTDENGLRQKGLDSIANASLLSHSIVGWDFARRNKASAELGKICDAIPSVFVKYEFQPPAGPATAAPPKTMSYIKTIVSPEVKVQVEMTYRVFGYAKVWMERLGLKVVSDESK
jgi:hypothetical protein